MVSSSGEFESRQQSKGRKLELLRREKHEGGTREGAAARKGVGQNVQGKRVDLGMRGRPTRGDAQGARKVEGEGGITASPFILG